MANKIIQRTIMDFAQCVYLFVKLHIKIMNSAKHSQSLITADISK